MKNISAFILRVVPLSMFSYKKISEPIKDAIDNVTLSM